MRGEDDLPDSLGSRFRCNLPRLEEYLERPLEQLDGAIDEAGAPQMTQPEDEFEVEGTLESDLVEF